MKKYAIVLVAVGLLIFASMVSVFANDIIWDDIGRGNLNLRTVLINPDNPQSIYFGSDKGVFKSDDFGQSWISILSVRGAKGEINFLSFDPQDKNSLYAVTGNGLYFSSNQGRNWKRIFKGKNYLENECTTLAVLPEALYLGTKGGLFVSKDRGRSWYKETGQIGKTSILAIAYNLKEPNSIYLACADGVFQSQDRGQSWIRIFVANATENGKEAEEISEDLDEAERFSGVRHIALDPNNFNHLYLATSKGVYKSVDGGGSWSRLSDYGLLSRDTRFLLIANSSNVYTATKSGVFEYKDGRWYELSFGFPASDIAFLAADRNGSLYVACGKGLYRASISNSGNQGRTIEIYFKDEPKISEVQQAAIKYAEVEPEKIIKWRKQAARKALLPQLSIGIDRNSADLWHWEGGSTTKTDDDILRRGRDTVDWDVTLNWDLGELIWNNDQASIDARSRLMVELRDNTLDEVTKLYFERIRVKMEIDDLSIEDRKKRVDKQLRLQELTASLDALTGGYFSQELKKITP